MSIFAQPPVAPFLLNVLDALNENLGFTANTVIVDNITSQWLFFPQIQRYCPPYQVGVVYPLPGLNTIQATFASPPNRPSGQVTASENATVTVLESPLQPSSGQSAFIGVASGQVMPLQVSYQVSGGSWFVSSSSDGQGQRIGFDQAMGYDLAATDSPTYQAARTANVWLKPRLAGGIAAATVTTLLTYNPPVGQLWRLLGYEVTFGNLAAGAGYIDVLIAGGVGADQWLGVPDPAPTTAGRSLSTGWRDLPGNGLAATVAGGALTVSVYSVIAVSGPVAGMFALYVGP